MKWLFLMAAVGVALPAAAATTNEPTVVTSDRLQVDYAQNFGTFEGNVLAIDARITVRADKMIVFFGTTNNVVGEVTNTVRTVQRLVAEGAVVINQETRKATSDRAEYTAADGKVVLTGNPQVQSPAGNVTGKRITFWHGQDKMDVESDQTETNRTRLIIYPEDQKKKEDGSK